MATQIIIAEKMVFGGNCIGKLNGKTIFIPFAIPGEKLEIEIVSVHRDYDTGRIIRILEKSEHRVEPICPLFGKCGGCTMQHIDSAYQQKLRAQMLCECFSREGITIPDIEIIGGPADKYRCRLQFHDGCLSERESNTLVSLTSCPVATPEINNYLATVGPENRPKGRIHVFGDSRIISPSFSNGIPKVIVAKEPQQNFPAPKKVSGKKEIKNHVKPRFSGSILDSANTCTVALAGKNLSFDVQGFFQSNLAVLEKTIETVCADMGGKNILDFYAGAGTFSVFFSDRFEKTTLVEHNRDALVFAEMNLAGKKHDSYGVSGEQWVKNNASTILNAQGTFDAVFIDPPRSGMEKSVCEWLCSNKSPQIRSMSCDPATHARDAARLIKSGYTLTKLYLLDFYPQTSHIESLAVFEYFA